MKLVKINPIKYNAYKSIENSMTNKIEISIALEINACTCTGW